MSIFDKVKDAAKGAAGAVGSSVKSMSDAVTGKGAEVTLEKTGALSAGGSVDVKVTVKSTGGAVKSEGVVIDLYGEDDPDENMLEKARELVMREKGPKHAFDIGGPFTVEAGGSKVVEGSFTLPAKLEDGLTWMIRARVKAFGNDPDTGWQKF
ncbi:MAG: hypothetical protein H6745_21990 [Deltaproteobacteria bacterium]|nr:hypothetical protein [Deltaproteobacteria bacterium]